MVNGNDPHGAVQAMPSLASDEKSAELIGKMLESNVLELKPEPNFTSEIGFIYTFVE